MIIIQHTDLEALIQEINETIGSSVQIRIVPLAPVVAVNSEMGIYKRFLGVHIRILATDQPDRVHTAVIPVASAQFANGQIMADEQEWLQKWEEAEGLAAYLAGKLQQEVDTPAGPVALFTEGIVAWEGVKQVTWERCTIPESWAQEWKEADGKDQE